MRVRPLTATAGVATAALLLSACGSDSPLEGKTGEEVAAAAADALEEAGAVHIAGTMTQDGEEVEVDLQLQGEDAAGTLTFAGADVELISVDGDIFMQAPTDFWAAFGMPEEMLGTFDGTWVLMPPEAAGEFETFTLAGFADNLREPDGGIKEETRSEELDGKPVRIVEQEDGSTLTVADDDPAYPLQMEGSGDSEGTVTFTDHGEQADISAPEDALDLDELAGA